MSGERGVSRRFLVVVACFLGALLAPAVAKAAPTIVSLTFDDGTADQYAARTMLAQHSLHATFYVNSNNIEATTNFLTWDQLAGLAADGNEIGGHTLDHVDLTSVTSTEATWPSIIWIARRSAPRSSRCVAKEWRSTCGLRPRGSPAFVP